MLIVDNGRSDGTRAIIERFCRRLPITVLSEPHAGKNRALNKSIKNLNSSFIIFTDDDAVPDRDCLSAWNEVAERCAECDIFGGRVDVDFPQKPPAWLLAMRHHYPELYAANSRSDGPVSAAAILGPNMGVRSRVFREGHRFSERIGPDASRQVYGMGSETDFCTRMEAHGCMAWFTGAARVRHIVRPHQMTREFVFTRAYKHGLGFGMRMAASQELTPADISGWRAHAAAALEERAATMPLQSIRDRALWQKHWRGGFREGIEGHLP